MKKTRKILALTLMLCMVMALGVWNTDANADWYTVPFTKVENKNFENVPTGISADKLVNTGTAATAATSTGTTSGTKEEEMKPGQIEYFYNPWAGTLVIRGKGAMVGFDEKHPAPWHTESKRALRVIIDEGITTISSEAFKDFIYLRSVVFPSTLKGIAENAFEKCEKLKRIEVVTEIEDAEKLIKASKSEELLMDDVKIVRVKKECVRCEICWLTTYWLDRVEIYRDKAGRPIRIIEHKCNGDTIDTGIKYLNEATAVNEAKEPETVERIYSVTTTLKGEKSAREKEVEEHGATLVKGNYDLNKQGRQVSGTEVTTIDPMNPSTAKSMGEDQVQKRTLTNAEYNSSGYGTRTWKKVSSDGTTEKIIETVDKNDRILSVSSVTYNPYGVITQKSETKNSYNDDGNIKEKKYTQTDADGNIETTENVRYSYNDDKQLKAVIAETKDGTGTVTDTVDTSYAYDSQGNLKTVTENTSSTSAGDSKTVTSYTYTDKGKKTGKTETYTTSYEGAEGETVQVAKTTQTTFDTHERATTVVEKETRDGEVFSETNTEYSYDSKHVVSESISVTKKADGSETITTSKYDSEGRLISSEYVEGNTDGTVNSGSSSYQYDGDGRVIKEKQVNTNAEGETETQTTSSKFDSDGRLLEEKQDTTDFDGSKTETTETRSFDSEGKLTTETEVVKQDDGWSSEMKTDVAYETDGSYTEKEVRKETEVTPKTEETPETVTETVTVTTTEHDNEGEIVNADISEEVTLKTGANPLTSVENLEEHVHEYSNHVAKEATCTEDGYEGDECECGASIVTVIPATGHNLGDLTVVEEPTCETDGSGTRTCATCGANISEPISATGHNLGDLTVVEEPTCGTNGSGTRTCATCGANISESISATGNHNYVPAVTQAPTCTAEGIRTYTCSVCGASYTESIPMTDHQYARTSTTASCTAGGTETWTCACGASYTKDVEAYGHSPEDIPAVAASCTTAGHTAGVKCSRCGTILTPCVDIPATGHDYGDGDACKVCGQPKES